MGGDQIPDKLADAKGVALAALCLQTAVITYLKEKGVFSREDLLSMTGTSLQVLESLSDVSAAEREKCKALLEGLSSAWIRRVSMN